MAALTLLRATYYDKIYGCWQGKSAGLTLGAGMRGQMPPGRLEFYAPVPGQPVASVALDFPLIWLQVLESVGPNFAPEDLAIAWLEHLDYTQEELGYAELNLRRGLPPPASGAHSNWFRSGSLGVMRADFWGMIAPGAPQVAAAYAYQDATIDHSEEGEWAAMFLAALLSASFFLEDPFVLLTIGLAMIPRTCRTARAVKAALAAGRRGATWYEARESVLMEAGDKNFSDVAQNMGFFTIGMLYGGGDFGTTLCAGVNCGYDTEAVGGALGAWMGVRLGKSGLPQAWTTPVRDMIIPGIGLRHIHTPLSLSEVAERTLNQGLKTLAERCPDVEVVEALPEPPPLPVSQEPIAEAAPSEAPLAPDTAAMLPAPEIAPAELLIATPEPTPLAEAEEEEEEEPTVEAIPHEAQEEPQKIATEPPQAPPSAMPEAAPVESAAPSAPEPEPAPSVPETPDPLTAIAWADNTLVKPLLVTSPTAQIAHTGDFRVVMESGDSPVISYENPFVVAFHVRNMGETPFVGRIQALVPSGWKVQSPPALGQRQYVAENNGAFYGEFTLSVPEGEGRIEIANSIVLRLAPENGLPLDSEFLLMGASCWHTVGPFANFDGEGFDRVYLPEERPGLEESYLVRTLQQARWERCAFAEASLELDSLFRGSSGVCYGRTTLYSPSTIEARLVANTNSGVKVWLNGRLIFRRHNRETFRPILGAGAWATDVTLNQGENHVLVKWVRGAEPIAFSLTVSDREGRGIPEVGNTNW